MELDADHASLDHEYPQATNTPSLDLSSLPPIFLSGTHLEEDELHELEEQLHLANAALTYDTNEARIVLSKVVKKQRIQLDMRLAGVWTEEVKAQEAIPRKSPHGLDGSAEALPAAKRPRVGGSQADAVVIDDDSSTASEGEETIPTVSRLAALPAQRDQVSTQAKSAAVRTPSHALGGDDTLIRVVGLDWLAKSRQRGIPLPFDDHTNFLGRRIPRPSPTLTSGPSPSKLFQPKTSPSKAILERAKEDAPSPTQARPTERYGKRKFNSSSSRPLIIGGSWESGHKSTLPNLLHATTSEAENSGSSSDLPEPPAWVRQNVKYACQRSTPLRSPNEAFIELLNKIRTARELTNDQVGVRAYSTSIASLAAYPHKLSSPREILRLPGCEAKIANLFVEWMNTGKIGAVEELEANTELGVLRLFYNIWGVGPNTAREFYYERAWRDLEDIVENGWSTLTRVQQIGVKYYEEFLSPIPRAEVESIHRTVHSHAVALRDSNIQSLIVGGYRRGKDSNNDVDIIVSHPDESQTLNIINDLVEALETSGWITHTLTLSLNSTNRGQQTLPFRNPAPHHGPRHTGFDTLDKALVVWQDPHWPTQTESLAADPKARNPNIHRRVDIIVSPWRTVGCAVVGWSGGTTFQRDLRRYANAVHNWKFDSSGVRSRVNGEVVDLEGWEGYAGEIGEGRARTMEEAERRVFEGFGLVFRKPGERCTG